MDVLGTHSPAVEKGARLPLSKLQIITDDSSVVFPNDSLRDMLGDLVAGLSEQVAIVDENWIIVSVNHAWKQMVKVAGYPELAPGTDYKDFLEAFALTGHENAMAVLVGVNAIDEGETDSFELTYAGVNEWTGRTLQLRIHRLRVQGHVMATISRRDVTDSAELRRVRRDCTAAILNSEAAARQRLTRELHDSTGQLLTGMGLLLATLKGKTKSAKPNGVVTELQCLLSEATRDIRSMSYLAQVLDVREIGVVKALDALAKGFGRRADIDIRFEVFGTLARRSPDRETALYRIAQEALSNVYRHARASHVRVSLVFRKFGIHLVVADDGIGISEEALVGAATAGVGIHGMRSRLAEFCGRLSIRSLRPGTALVASIPTR